MTLKIAINGQNKRLITPLRTFINGQLVRLPKGFTFINGQKVQLWGTTRTQFFSIPYDLGFDNSNLYIDDNNLYTHGTALIGVTSTGTTNPTAGGSSTPRTGSGSGTTYIARSNCLTTFTITNPSSATKDGYSEWGANPMFSPEESDADTYIYYLATGTTRNKVKIAKNNGISVMSAYTIPVDGVSWCVPSAHGNTFWGRSYYTRPLTNYQIGYNGTAIMNVSTLANPSWDNGNEVVCHSGYTLLVFNMSGRQQLTNTTYITSKLVDSGSVLVAGYNRTPSSTGSATKIAKYNMANNTTEWEVIFTDDRQPDIVGEGGNRYYVIDKPMNYESADQDVYLRIYDKDTGAELEAVVLSYETNTGARIIGWQTFPVKTKNGILSMRYLSGGRLYICKVFVD